jgi:hypothetical protein
VPRAPKPRRGRPPRADRAATERVEIRATPDERAAWEHRATEAKASLSEWIRERCNTR